MTDPTPNPDTAPEPTPDSPGAEGSALMRTSTWAPPAAAVLALIAGLMFPGAAAALLVVGALLGIVSASFAFVAVLGRIFRPGAALTSLSLGVSAFILDPLLRLMSRPLTSTPLYLLIPAVLLAIAGLLLWRYAADQRLQKVTAGALVVAAVSSGVGHAGPGDVPGWVSWSLAIAGPALLLALGILRVAYRERTTWLLRVVAIVAAIGGLAAMVRIYAILVADEKVTAAAQQALLLAALGVLLVVAVGATSLLLPLGTLRRPSSRWASGVVAVIALALLSQTATLPLDQKVDEGLQQIQKTTLSDYVLASAMTGEAGAMPREEFRNKTFEQCDALNSRDCFITHYDDLALRDGVGAAVADLLGKVRTNQGETFAAHCHQVVHNLGQLAFTLADDFQDAAVLDPQVCGTGYTHGLWEQQFTLLGDKVIFTKTPTLCKDLNMTTPWYKWTCSHILGHIMVTRMMGDPGKAVEYCVTIPDTQAVTDCLTGGWMNFFQDDKVIAETTKAADLEHLFSVCYSALDSVKFLCYQEMFPALYPLVGNDDYLAAKACLEYSEPSKKSGDPWQWDVSYQDRCIQGLARAVTVSSFIDYRIIGPRCLSMPEEAHSACLTAGAASVVLNTGSTAAAFQLCRQITDEHYRTYCYFWSKYARKILANGPNSQNLPGKDEIRLPEHKGQEQNTGPRSQPFQVTGPQ